MDHWTTEQLRQLVCSKDLDNQLAQLEKLIRCLGFDCYAFSFTTPTFSITQSNCPNPWGERYRRHEPAVVEPLLAHSRHSSFPLLWTPEAFTSPPELWAGAQDHGVCLGWIQPFHDEHGRFSSLSVVRQHPPVTVNELYSKGAAVLWLVQVLHATAAALANDPQGPSSSE